MKVCVKTKNGKAFIDVDPTTNIGKLERLIMGKFDIPTNIQKLEYNSQPLDDETATIESCGICYKDLAMVDVTDPKYYKVEMSDWMDPFNYSPSSQEFKKHVGKRSKKKLNPLSM